jgi:uncharacterized metal-binding protein YceD (DUF177 family)
MSSPIPDPEWSHKILIAQLGDKPLPVSLAADERVRKALARRFGLIDIATLDADIALTREDEKVRLTGKLHAEAMQACSISGQGVAVKLSEPLALLFLPDATESATPGEEIELAADDCDTVWHDGRVVDVAEAVAQSFALALDPYPRAPNAVEIARAAGIKAEEEAGAFGVLAALKAQMTGKAGG